MVDLKNIFNEFVDESDDFQNNGVVDPKLNLYPCVYAEDQEAVSVIEPDFKQGPWIAGGAALKWYQYQPVSESDIDVFCKDAKQAQAVIDRIKSYNRYNVKHQSENAVTISYHRRDNWGQSWTIQVITRRYFPNCQSVIDSFDLTVCQVATAGTEWILGEHTARDIRERTLRFRGDLQPDAVKRLVKYWTYGYHPVEGTIELIQNNRQANWKFASDGDYENIF
jgi:hypothetical protein